MVAAELQARIRTVRPGDPRPNARYVLYWARFNRRVEWNHAVQAAAWLANELDLPLLYYERLGHSEPYANARLHTFVLEGVPHTARRLERLGIGYIFDLQRGPRDPGDVLQRLALDAAALFSDDYPDAIAGRYGARLPSDLSIPVYLVDSSCIVPMNMIGERQYAAFSIRPKIGRLLSRFLKPLPPLRLRRRYSYGPHAQHTGVDPSRISELVASCQLDHSVPPSVCFRGGAAEAERRLAKFLATGLRRYGRQRHQPAEGATSNASPYLHFGQISALEIALAVKSHAEQQGLIADEFLEQLIVRRELAFNFCRHTARVDSLEALPQWAANTLARHSADARHPCYSGRQFLNAETHDDLWNATQKELLLTGKIHGYYRMYWGKKIIEWSPTYEEALRTMIELHDRFALDGRDPNTFTNVLWCFGLHDRPWAERPVLGTLRYLSREGMKRKTNVPAYLDFIGQLERTGRTPEAVR